MQTLESKPVITAKAEYTIKGRGLAITFSLKDNNISDYKEMKTFLGKDIIYKNKEYTIMGIEAFAIPECNIKDVGLLLKPI